MGLFISNTRLFRLLEYKRLFVTLVIITVIYLQIKNSTTIAIIRNFLTRATRVANPLVETTKI